MMSRPDSSASPRRKSRMSMPSIIRWPRPSGHRCDLRLTTSALHEGTSVVEVPLSNVLQQPGKLRSRSTELSGNASSPIDEKSSDFAWQGRCIVEEVVQVVRARCRGVATDVRGRRLQGSDRSCPTFEECNTVYALRCARHKERPGLVAPRLLHFPCGLLLLLAAHDRLLGGIAQAGVRFGAPIQGVVALHPIAGVQRVASSRSLKRVRASKPNYAVCSSRPV